MGKSGASDAAQAAAGRGGCYALGAGAAARQLQGGYRGVTHQNTKQGLGGSWTHDAVGLGPIISLSVVGARPVALKLARPDVPQLSRA